jgi:hypothetical protein
MSAATVHRGIVLGVFLGLLWSGAAMADLPMLEPTPACGPAGSSVAVAGVGWSTPAVPSEYVLYFDGALLAQQGPLAPSEQPALSFAVPGAAGAGTHSVAVGLRHIGDQSVEESVTLTFAVPCPVSQAAPNPSFVQPDRATKRALGGTVLLIAKQRDRRIPPSDIRAATFEYSADGVTWHPIWVSHDSSADRNAVEVDWDARWDVSALPSGRYFVRITMETFDGRRGSYQMRVAVRAPPTAVMVISPGATPGSVVFDGRGSLSPDEAQGCCREWTWDFGDGTTGSGPVVEHTYADLGSTYPVSLTVTTHFMTTAKSMLLLAFVGGLPTTSPLTTCECTAIAVRKAAGRRQETAFGPDASIRSGVDLPWPATITSNGKKIGPLLGPPRMPGNTAGRIGYAFEVLTSVIGNPDLCRQIQLVRFTSTEATGGTQHKLWTGTQKDIDLDGVIDIDVSTKADCDTAGGTWSTAAAGKCTLSFPKGDTRFGPDEYEQGSPDEPEGAYEWTWALKAHPDSNIIWFDDPSSADASYALDFVAMVRGTDGKYCFVDFSVVADRATPKEDLTVNSFGNSVPKSSLPALGW